MTTTTTTQLLDFGYEEPTLAEAIQTLEGDFGIQVQVVREIGPGGGWPEVRLTGNRDRVLTALQEAWGFVSDAEEYLEQPEQRVTLARLNDLAALEDLLGRLLDARDQQDNDEVFELLEQLDDLFD